MTEKKGNVVDYLTSEQIRVNERIGKEKIQNIYQENDQEIDRDFFNELEISIIEVNESFIYIRKDESITKEIEEFIESKDYEFVKLEELASDGNYRNPKTIYFRNESDILVMDTDDGIVYTDEHYAECLIKCLIKHPHRTIKKLKEISETEEVTVKDHKIDSNKKYLVIFDDEDYCGYENIDFELFEEIEDIDYENQNFGEIRILKAKNVETQKIVKIKETISRWQGSADYTAEIIEGE